MKTLHEMATKLQEYIIRSQQDAHNQTNMNVTKYNNLKLKMDTKIHYPHVIICIGISEATFNIADGTKTDGGLGPDEKYVRKWLGGSNIISDLKEINLAMFDLIKAEDENKSISMEGESDEAKADAPRKKTQRPKTIDDILPNEVPYLGDEEPQEMGEELMAVEETLDHHTEVIKEDDGGPESVENVKKGLQDYIKSMFRRK
jgi:hypothetical protein